MKKNFLAVIVILLFGSLWSGFAFGSGKNRDVVLSDLSGSETSQGAEAFPMDDSFDFFDEEFHEDAHVSDPFVVWNRLMYHVNDRLYFYMLRPVAELYGHVVPNFIRSGFKNFFYNLAMPVRLVNCILQGKLNAAGEELGRFCLNSTVGVLGFGNPARKYPDMKSSDEDLGQTLAVYGLPNGFYIVWPVFGPSTLRDSIGMFGDRFLNPVAAVEPMETSISISAFDMLNKTSLRIGEYEAMKESALEPYVAIRDGYIQFRKKMVNQ